MRRASHYKQEHAASSDIKHFPHPVKRSAKHHEPHNTPCVYDLGQSAPLDPFNEQRYIFKEADKVWINRGQ